jgi:hypothetical protein
VGVPELPKKPPRNDPSDDDIEEIQVEEDEASRTEPRPSTLPRPGQRPATRVVPIPTDPEDDELSLFTDEKVPPRKKR